MLALSPWCIAFGEMHKAAFVAEIQALGPVATVLSLMILRGELRSKSAGWAICVRLSSPFPLDDEGASRIIES